MSIFADQLAAVDELVAHGLTGRVDSVTGMILLVSGLPAPVGAMCEVAGRSGRGVRGQVVGFRGEQTVVMPLGELAGVSKGDAVRCLSSQQKVSVSGELLGRVINGLGDPIDGGDAVHAEQHYPLIRSAPPAMHRRRIDEPLGTGIRSIDALLTAGRGQRLGIFAGTGVGKSILMGMIARYTSADVTVVALVGERGREVGDFLRKDLGAEGLKRSVVVVSTSDESPVLRIRATFLATAVAEYFRDQGNDVLLLVDSLTRLAMAQRQIGLAAGEPPATKGYTPSVFAMLPQLLERSGRTEQGSITGFYTVLVEGDDINEPVSDAVRGTLDGHVWLSRSLANRGHYPAVSVLESISRVMIDVVDAEHLAAARRVGRILASWADIEDLVNIGAYAAGSNDEYDLALQGKPLIDEFLRQAIEERISFADSRQQLLSLDGELGRLTQKIRANKQSAVAAGR